MFRIYLEYTKDLILSRPDYFIFGIFAIFAFVSISILDVLANTTGILRNDAFSVFSFFIVAIKNTSWVMQVFIVGFIVRVVIAGTKPVFRNLNLRRWNLIKLRY